MSDQSFLFVDRTGAAAEPLKFPEAFVIKKQIIDAEVERLANLPRPDNGRRISLITNPNSGAGFGITPGIGVSLCVLKSGESTTPVRQNSSQIDFCIQGAGSGNVAGREIAFSQYDTWTTPPWSVYQYFNDTDQIQVRLSYSNAPLLEKLNVHIVDDKPAAAAPVQEASAENEGHSSRFDGFQVADTGEWLMPYERLINPPPVNLNPLHWQWSTVSQELDKLRSLDQKYIGRRLYLMYDPATGRTNGTTNNFFATITVRPANIIDRPHRHVSAAVNYYFAGKGHSVVQGRKYYWEAGDLMFSAPGWAIHNHASGDESVYELTIQDQPLHIAMGSLLWQEDLKREPRLLGVSEGFGTNRAAGAF